MSVWVAMRVCHGNVSKPWCVRHGNVSKPLVCAPHPFVRHLSPSIHVHITARELAYAPDRNAPSAIDTPRVARFAACGTAQEQCAQYRARRAGGG